MPDTIRNKPIILSGLEEYGLTDEEAFFIVSFTGSYSSWVNRPLRDGYDLQTKCTRYFADNLDKVLDKLPCFNDQYVFRMDTPSLKPSEPTLQYQPY